TITNSDISITAAIAGSKIDPDFVGHDISTTGTLEAGAATIDGTLEAGNTTITGTLEITEQLVDENGNSGTLGQVLTTTATGTEWAPLPTVPSPFHAFGKITDR